MYSRLFSEFGDLNTLQCFVTMCFRERRADTGECLRKAAVYTGRQAAHQWQAPGQCTSGEADKSWQVRPGLESDHTSPAGANTSADSSTLQVAWHGRKCDLPLTDHDWIKPHSNRLLFVFIVRHGGHRCQMVGDHEWDWRQFFSEMKGKKRKKLGHLPSGDFPLLLTL